MILYIDIIQWHVREFALNTKHIKLMVSLVIQKGKDTVQHVRYFYGGAVNIAPVVILYLD